MQADKKGRQLIKDFMVTHDMKIVSNTDDKTWFN